MACPYFDPLEPRRQTDRSRSAMLPLGDAWDGLCRAVPGSACQPDETTLLHFCNLGYARGCCPRFPAGDGPDAARFTVSSSPDEDLRIYYVLERDHHPWSHGPLELAAEGQESLRRLGRAYMESYRRRVSEASHR